MKMKQCALAAEENLIKINIISKQTIRFSKLLKALPHNLLDSKMKTLLSNLLQILTGFLYFITILAKPLYKDSSLLMPQEAEYQSLIKSPLGMPPINLNIIVVPIVRELKPEEKLVDYINNRMELPG